MNNPAIQRLQRLSTVATVLYRLTGKQAYQQDAIRYRRQAHAINVRNHAH